MKDLGLSQCERPGGLCLQEPCTALEFPSSASLCLEESTVEGP